MRKVITTATSNQYVSVRHIVSGPRQVRRPCAVTLSRAGDVRPRRAALGAEQCLEGARRGAGECAALLERLEHVPAHEEPLFVRSRAIRFLDHGEQRGQLAALVAVEQL